MSVEATKSRSDGKPTWKDFYGRLFIRFLTVTLRTCPEGSGKILTELCPAGVQPSLTAPGFARPFHEGLLKSVPMFCYPESDLSLASSSSEMYTFTMTDADGHRLYGFCRRRDLARVRFPRPEILQECLCFVSSFPWFSLFHSLLEVVDQRKSVYESHPDCKLENLDNFLLALYAVSVPQKPGETFRVIAGSSQVPVKLLPESYHFQRPLFATRYRSTGLGLSHNGPGSPFLGGGGASAGGPSSYLGGNSYMSVAAQTPPRSDAGGSAAPGGGAAVRLLAEPFDHIDFGALFSSFDEQDLLGLLASLMTERRILFTSSSLSRLTGCVHAAAALLAPLEWQHIMIPVLPASLLSTLLAPMPFLIGVHSSLQGAVQRESRHMESVVFVNCDTGFVNFFRQDVDALPIDATVRLRHSLRRFYSRTGAMAQALHMASLEQLSTGGGPPGASPLDLGPGAGGAGASSGPHGTAHNPGGDLADPPVPLLNASSLVPAMVKFSTAQNVTISRAVISFYSLFLTNYFCFYKPGTTTLNMEEYKLSLPRGSHQMLDILATTQHFERFIAERGEEMTLDRVLPSDPWTSLDSGAVHPGPAATGFFSGSSRSSSYGGTGAGAGAAYGGWSSSGNVGSPYTREDMDDASAGSGGWSRLAVSGHVVTRKIRARARNAILGPTTVSGQRVPDQQLFFSPLPPPPSRRSARFSFLIDPSATNTLPIDIKSRSLVELMGTNRPLSTIGGPGADPFGGPSPSPSVQSLRSLSVSTSTSSLASLDSSASPAPVSPVSGQMPAPATPLGSGSASSSSSFSTPTRQLSSPFTGRSTSSSSSLSAASVSSPLAGPVRLAPPPQQQQQQQPPPQYASSSLTQGSGQSSACLLDLSDFAPVAPAAPAQGDPFGGFSAATPAPHAPTAGACLLDLDQLVAEHTGGSGSGSAAGAGGAIPLEHLFSFLSDYSMVEGEKPAPMPPPGRAAAPVARESPFGGTRPASAAPSTARTGASTSAPASSSAQASAGLIPLLPPPPKSPQPSLASLSSSSLLSLRSSLPTPPPATGAQSSAPAPAQFHHQAPGSQAALSPAELEAFLQM
ncbi:hypothetical protein H696_03629 [Fonticula alba]|uniref:UDENN domain-containing protein n=1 Tax=Fonticula alba TaxID=691883 RepID=A0A058Z7B9_FONAL|nr:hypothetical protein H696_03629 [Fonticula alba]KCV70170.1 hypothetical protein H696_03629 [Fonticula alba]|eukprot:XP_009495776.1 hypothetical protein H696_03629 [Fonticula alba]